MDKDALQHGFCGPLHLAVQTLCQEGREQLATAAVDALRASVESFASARPQLEQSEAEAVWRSCCELWNLCVEISNTTLPARPSTSDGALDSASAAAADGSNTPCVQRRTIALLRQSVCEVLSHIIDSHLAEEEHVTRLGFALKSAQEWVALDNFPSAELVLSLASPWASVFEDVAQDPATSPDKRNNYCSLAFDAHMARLIVAWRLDQQALATSMVAKCRNIIDNVADASDARLAQALRLRMASQLLEQANRITLPITPTASTAATKETGNDNNAPTGAAAQSSNEPIDLNKVHDAVSGLTLAYELLQRARPASTHGVMSGAGDESGAGMEALRLESKVLLSLALCHHFLEDFSATLACTRALRQLKATATSSGTSGACDSAAHPAVALLAFAAHLAVRDVKAATGEALGVVASEESGREACLAVAMELVQEQHGLGAEGLRSVLDLLLGRFSADGAAFAQIMTAILATVQASGADSAGAASGGLSDREALSLALMEQHQELAQAAAADAEQRNALYCALCGHAAKLFQGRRYIGAVKFYTAAMEFAEDSAKAVLCRCLGLCHMGLGAPEKAAEFVALAETYQPKQVPTSFMRFKLALESGDAKAAVKEVQQMVACTGFKPAMLQMACQEALTTGNTSVAGEALTLLHALLVKRSSAATAACSEPNSAAGPSAAAGQDDQQHNGPEGKQGAGQSEVKGAEGEQPDLPEATVLRCLVKLELDEVAAALAAPGGVGGARKGKGGVFTERAGVAAVQPGSEKDDGEVGGQCALQLKKVLMRLTDHLQLAYKRLKRIGLEAFVGPEEAHREEHLAWFASTAWNAGLDAADARHFEPSAVLMHLCAQLLDLHPSPAPRHLRQQRMALLVAGSAALEVYKEGDARERTNSLKLAGRMVGLSKAAAAKLAEVEATGGAEAAAGGLSGLADVFTILQEFGIAARRGDEAALKETLERAAALQCVKAEHLLKMAAVLEDPEFSHPAILLSALQATLQRLMSSGTPDCARVALVVRQMVGAASNNEERLKVLTEGGQILGSMPPQDVQEGGDKSAASGYPHREARWLAGTTWNTGLARLRVGDKRGAALLRLGLDLLRHVPKWAAPDRAAMEAVVAEVEVALGKGGLAATGAATV